MTDNSRAALSVIGELPERSTLPLDTKTIRIGRRCQYEPRVKLSNPRVESTVVKATPLSLPTVRPVSVSAPKFSQKLLLSGVNNTITEHLVCAVGDLSSVRNVAVRYFRSIHLWFPIVSEIPYHERISKIYENPSAEYSLLSLSMALITAPPPEKETSDRFTTLYMLVKSAIAMAEAANLHSLEIVQSRLLVSLFEFGHTIEPAAFISLAATARAAVAIGLNKEINKPCSDNLVPCSKKEEGNRVWWGIVMLDRYTLQLP